MTAQQLVKMTIFLVNACVLSFVLGQNQTVLKTDSIKPLEDICWKLVDRLHWQVTYEEPPVLDKSQLISEQASTGISRHARRKLAMSATVPDVASSAEGNGTAQYEALQRVVDGYNRSGHGDVFTVIDRGGGLFHVVPTGIRRADGTTEPFEPLLSTRVTLAERSYRLGELVSEILAQVSSKRGSRISVATVPTNLFAQEIVTEKADDESARDVLVRAFDEMNSRRLKEHDSYLRMTWHLLYNADEEIYFFNVHVASKEDRPNRALSSEQVKHEPAADTPWFSKQ